MKLNEFADKLATVSDAKLRQMLQSSRVAGPEVAVSLILSECKRRGMNGMPGENPSAFVPESRSPGSDTTAYAQEQAGYAGADAPPVPLNAAVDPLRAVLADDPAADGPPATAPDWLNEESKTGMPVAVKVLLVLIVLGGILGLAWKFSH